MNRSSARPRIAVVIPVFNEEPVLPELFRRLEAMMGAAAGAAWTVVLVDDGSRDRSAALAAGKAASDPRFTALELSRNFGHQPALMAGIARAHELGCDAMVTMDADLQDPPELIPQLIAEWRKGAGVVLAVRRSRQEHGLRRMGFDLFHGAFNRLADFPIEANTGTFGLLGAEAVEALVALPERHRFFPGLRAWVGFPTAQIVYDREERAAGTPAQTFFRLVRYAMDGVFSFSYLPLRLMTYAGVAVSGAGFLLGSFFVVRRLMGVEIAFTGFTTLVTLVLFLGGLQLIGIGVIGEYLARVYDEVKQRPLYVVKRKER
jgi:glycosyltransferase involved in cell wall biosynthesis